MLYIKKLICYFVCKLKIKVRNMIKKSYKQPTVEVVFVNIEKGFATSAGNEGTTESGAGIQDFTDGGSAF